MTISIRLLCGLVSVLACLVGVTSVQPSLLASLGFNVREAMDFPRQSMTENQRRSRLDYQQDVTGRRIKAKMGLVGRLIDGEMSLFEVAAWFKYLNENPVDCQDRYKEAFPGATPEEKVCRQVIEWVTREVSGRVPSSQAELERARWEAVLRQHLARHGKLTLPDLW